MDHSDTLKNYSSIVSKRIETYGNQDHYGTTDNCDELLDTMELIISRHPDAVGFASWPSCMHHRDFEHKLTSLNIYTQDNHVHTITFAHTESYQCNLRPLIEEFCRNNKLTRYDVPIDFEKLTQ